MAAGHINRAEERVAYCASFILEADQFPDLTALIQQGETSVDEVARISGNDLWRSFGDAPVAEPHQISSETPSLMTEKLLLVMESDALRHAMTSSLEALNFKVTAVDDFEAAKGLTRQEALEPRLLPSDLRSAPCFRRQCPCSMHRAAPGGAV
jgi:hypothetical protein